MHIFNGFEKVLKGCAVVSSVVNTEEWMMEPESHF